MENEIIQLGGPHLKTCPCGCKTPFYGRRNQVFVNTQHKAKYNNLLRSERRAPLAGIFAQMETNYRILEKYYPSSTGQWIKFSPLLKEGFDANAPYTLEKDIDTGTVYRVLANFLFTQSKDNQHVIIFKNK